MKKREPTRQTPVSHLPSSIDDLGNRDKKGLEKNYDRAQRDARLKARQEEERFAESRLGKLLRSSKARWLIRDGRFAWDLLLITLLGAGVLLAGGFHYLRSGLDGDVEVSTPQPARLFHTPAQAEALIGQFYAANDVDEQLTLVRHPEKVEPLMRRYYDGKFNPWWQGLEFGVTMPTVIVEQYGRDFSVTGITFQESTLEKVICIEDTPQGPRLDWETAVGYQPIDWTNFKAERPQRVYQLRCIVSQSDYYNFAFDDPERWTCFHLRDPYGTEEIYGYLPTDSELRRRFDDQMRGIPVQNLRAIVTVRFPEGSRSDNQVEIVDDVIDGWFFNLEGDRPHPLLDEAQ